MVIAILMAVIVEIYYISDTLYHLPLISQIFYMEVGIITFHLFTQGVR